MERVAVVVNQVGYGHYPTDWIILKPQYRGHVIGYLQWNTLRYKGRVFTRMDTDYGEGFHF